MRRWEGGRGGALAGGALGSTPAPVLPPLRLRASPVSGLRAVARGALGHPAAAVSASPHARPKYDAEVPRSWDSLRVPSHQRGGVPASHGQGHPRLPGQGAAGPAAGGAPAGRWAGLCPAVLPTDPSTHHPQPPRSRDLTGVPHCPPQPHREFAAAPTPPPPPGLAWDVGGPRSPPAPGLPPPPPTPSRCQEPGAGLRAAAAPPAPAGLAEG